jgi:hypothetical protein
MPRRSKPKETKRDWRWWASTLLNGAVVVSMVIGTIFVFAGVPTRTAPQAPTNELPTLAPTTIAPPTAPPATPTPKASADYQFAVAGDSRDGDVVYSKLFQRGAGDGSAFLIHTGDLVPSGTKDEWSRRGPFHFR